MKTSDENIENVSENELKLKTNPHENWWKHSDEMKFSKFLMKLG